MGDTHKLTLEEILTEKQTQNILKQALGTTTWNLKESKVNLAMDGIAGFLGDHLKAVLKVDINGEEKAVNLFIKRISAKNKPKAEFINDNNFFKREMLMYEFLEEIYGKDKVSWSASAYLYTNSLVVMPDLTMQGYYSRNFLDVLDSDHVFITTTSIAQFHAAFVNYETKKSEVLERPYSMSQEFGDILEEAQFCESPWLKVCSKVSVKMLKMFSTKSYYNVPNLESKLTQLYLEACQSLVEHKGSINTLLHRDLWVNNIMFKYEKNVPINAVLVDYQCLRYGPPAFDLMSFLHLTTDRSFRKEREKEVFNHYYSTFINDLDVDSKEKVARLGYDRENFVMWCEKARMFGMVAAIALHPYALMDPRTAQNTFDDPETYAKYLNEDRSEPVIAHASKCEVYKRRNLEVTEEFVDTYVLEQ